MLGLIGKKVGMTQVFDELGELMPVTVIKVEPNLVVDSGHPRRTATARFCSVRRTRSQRG